MPRYSRHRTRHSLPMRFIRRTDRAVFVPGRLYQRERRHYARYHTMGPICVGMPRSVQAGVVRYGDRSVYSEGAHAKRRGDGDIAVRVCDVDFSRRGELRCAPQRAPQAPPWDPRLRRRQRTDHCCRMLRPSRRHNAKALRRPTVNGASLLRGPYSGQNLGD